MPKDASYPQLGRMEQFATQLHDAHKKSAAFDDSHDTWNTAPDTVNELANAMIDAQNTGFGSPRAAIAATLDSAMQTFNQMHGQAPSGAVLHNAVRTALNGVSATNLSRAGVNVVLDDSISIQSGAPFVSNRALLALYNSVIEAVPFAGYVPMSDGLAGKVIVVNHRTGSKTGAYTENQVLDGIYGGKPFMSNERVVMLQTSDNITFTNSIVYSDGDLTGAPIIPSTTEILVNGLPSGGAAINANINDVGGRSALTGSAMIQNTEYTFTGNINIANGNVSVTFNTALPAGVEVHAVASINYEDISMKDKRPVFISTAREYDFRATFASAYYRITSEAKTQWDLEIRLDAGSEAMLAMRQQHSAEKHMNALRSMHRIAKNYVTTIDLNSATRQDERSRESMWRDVLFGLTQADTEMLERTNAFGVGVIYVGGKGKAELSALPREVFEPSALNSTVGIYRIGRLFGAYEVYYAPHIVQETNNSLEMLLIGRSNETGLNPYIMGDVVAPTFKKLDVSNDLSEGAAYFYAGAARINPYAQAAQGAAILTVTGL